MGSGGRAGALPSFEACLLRTMADGAAAIAVLTVIGPAALIGSCRITLPGAQGHLLLRDVQLTTSGAGENGGARYIDRNCRLVGPMSAYLAGLDLVELLLQVSSGKSPAGAARSWAGVRTYLGMQSLLGRGLRGGGRRELLAELRRMQLIEREVIA
jgi:hypothetical protein